MNAIGLGPKQDQQAQQTSGSSDSTETGNPLIDALSKEKNLSDQTAKIKAIYESGMNQDQINQALTREGIDPQGAQYTMLKSLTNENRAPLVWNILSATTQSGQQIAAIHELTQKGVLTTGVTAQWLKTGQIDASMKKILDKEIGIANGTRTAGAGASNYWAKQFESNAMQLAKAKLPRLSTTNNFIQMPKLSIPNTRVSIKAAPGSSAMQNAPMPQLRAIQLDQDAGKIKFGK